MALSQSPKAFSHLLNVLLDGRNTEDGTYLLIYEIQI